MNDIFYAHSKERELPEKWQPLEDHLRNVAEKMKGSPVPLACGSGGTLLGFALMRVNTQNKLPHRKQRGIYPK